MNINNLKINKIQKYVNILIILIVVIGFIYFIINSIIKVFDKPDKLYLSKLKDKFSAATTVTDYNQFYTIDGILSQFIVACQNEKYSELYDVMIDEYKKVYSYSDTKKILEKYRDNNFSTDVDNIFYESTGQLKKAYMIDDMYILKFNDIKGDKMYLVIQMSSGKYKFTFIETE